MVTSYVDITNVQRERQPLWKAWELAYIPLAPVIDQEEAPDAVLRPLQRLRLLCDEGSLHVLRSSAMSERTGDDTARPGDGVVGASGTVAGRPIFCFAQEASVAGGEVGAGHVETIVRIQRLAGKARVPVIGFVESGGARMQEGLAAVGGYARVLSEHVSLSGEVPQISVITGASAQGGCYSPDLTDFVIMTEAARPTSARDLGRTPVHARSGVSHFAVQSDVDAILLVRQLLAYLPQNAEMAPAQRHAVAPAGPDPGEVVPLDPRRLYDMRTPLEAIIDGGSLLEVSPQSARNIVTAFARIEGRPVGIVANQPKVLGGAIDVDASQKGARFVRTCNAFGIPLVVLVDTPGFAPGIEQEAIGVIPHGAELLHAFAEATVPRYTVVLRKAFGGAYVAMNSKHLGADLTLAWPRAQLGTATRPLASDDATRHLGVREADQAGHIDDVIAPAETRTRLAQALAKR